MRSAMYDDSNVNSTEAVGLPNVQTLPNVQALPEVPTMACVARRTDAGGPPFGSP